MKIFQLLTTVIVFSLFNLSMVSAQCDAAPIPVDQSMIDIQLETSSFPYCPNNDEDVDIADSGDPITNAWIESGNTGNADCDPGTATFQTPTYVDTNMPDTCPEIIEREWTVTYDDANGQEVMFIQYITLVDDVAPEIGTCPPDVTVELSSLCDENDPNVLIESGFIWSDVEVMVTQAEFESAGGVVDEDCDMNVMAFYIDSDPTFLDGNCPNEFISFTRTWRLEDACENMGDECEQMILIFDNQDPVIVDCPGGGTPIEINVANGEICDQTNPEIEAQSGFAFDTGPVIVDVADFNSYGTATDNCNDGDIYEAQYADEIIGVGCETGIPYAMDIVRHWTVTDLCGNTATCDQEIRLLDMEMPVFDLFPDFFYDQGPQGVGSGIWEIESIFCNAQIDFTSEYVLPGMAEIMDNCTMFGDLNIGYSPDISAGPIDVVEGDNVMMMVITDQCNNRFIMEWTISMVCLGCGPDEIFEACTDPPTTCELEEIAGYSSCTPEFTTGFGTLCEGSLDNPSYFEFIAGAEDLSFVIEASNCADGGGIQAVITDPCDPLTCYSDLSAGQINPGQQTQVNASGLTVGNIYQLVVDGWAGDECNWTILSISALPFSIPDPSPEEPIAELVDFPGCDVDELIFCQGTSASFWPDTFEDALYFFCWDLDNMNGVTSANGADDCTEFTAFATLGEDYSCNTAFSSCGPLELTFSETGVYNLCLIELANGCDTENPSDYCWEITVIENGRIEFGEVKVCEHDLAGGWYPDILGPNGESWQGDPIFIEGETSELVTDDCGCMFDYVIDVTALIEEETVVEMEICAYDLENFFDPGLGVDWNDIEDYYNEPFGSNPFAYLNPLEEGSMQTGYDGIACDTFVYIEFFLYDVPGQIVQTPGPVCDVILGLELDLTLFPEDLIDPDELNYTWYDGSGNIIGTENTVSVTQVSSYELIIEYFLDSGSTCQFLFEIDVSDFGNPPAAPTFVQSPNETCITELAGIVYSVPPAASAEYLWEVNNGTFTANAGNDEITITITDPSMTTEVCVSADSACGPSPQSCETITVTPSPEIELLPVMDVCVNQSTTIATNVIAGSADEFFWTIPGGSFTQAGSSMAPSLVVSWATAGTYMVEVAVEDPSGCLSNTAMIEVNVLDPLAPPTASCSLSTSNTVEITLVDNPDGGAGSTFIVTTGQTATEDNGILTVGGLTPGDEVTIVYTTLGGTHPCGDQSDMITCIATDCPLNPALDQPDAICLDDSAAPFQFTETAGNPGGIWSGPGTDAGGMFDPELAGPGTHNITYEVEDLAADCSASANVSVVVFPSPEEDFAPSVDTVCIGEILTIAFDDSPGKTYTWDFDADNSGPVTDDTDFALSYSSEGDKQIEMSIETGPGCEFSITKNIYVRPALVFPGVFCGGLSPVSVGFEWDPIANVVEYMYEYTIDGGDLEMGMTTDTEISIDGLAEGNVVDITVTAIDINGCSNPIALQTCIAQDCPDFEIAITASEELVCWDPVNGINIQLEQMTTIGGAAAVGTGEWGGSDLLDPVTGEFNPDGPDSYVLSYVFSQDGTACPGSESITINILESPESDFTQDFEQICIEDEVTFTLDAVYNDNYTYDWTSTFDDADYALTDNGDGTFTVQFFNEGTGDFSLLSSVAGCESPVSTLSVEVGSVPELPVISCTEDLGYVLFEWTAVDCVEEYIVFINGMSMGGQTETSFELPDLGANETVEIEIEIVSSCLCEFPATVSETCTAQDCEEATITFDATVATEYCLASITPFTYTADVVGAEIDNSGTFTWSGDGVDENGNVDFSGFDPGLYNVDVMYEEDDCFYSNSIMIEILGNPSLVIDTENAPCPGASGVVNINAEGNGPFNIIAEGNTLEAGPNTLQAGDYTVMIVDDNGCESEASFTIGTDAEPTDDLIVPTTQILNGTETILSYTTSQDNIENVVWTVNGDVIADVDCSTGDCFTQLYTPASSGEYEVCTYAYYDGAVCELIECRTFSAFEIVVNSFYIPNVITPGNDQDPINKTLSIFVEGDAVTILSVGIFDRWGNRVYHNEEQQVYETDQEGVLWDGRFEDSKDFIAGVYVYLIETEIDGFKEWYTDDITLIE